MSRPPLKPLHHEHSLSPAKLAEFSKMTNSELIDSLQPERPGALKVRPDGTVIDGHHRVKILRDRGFDVDSLTREVIPKDELSSEEL